MRETYCPGCHTDQLFEQPECLDDHDVDCPDWACVVCGFAIFTGPFPLPVEVAAIARVARVA